MLDDYVTLLKIEGKNSRVKIFNVYKTIIFEESNTEERVETGKSRKNSESSIKFRDKANFRAINYSSITELEPFRLGEEDKSLEPIKVLESLREQLPSYNKVIKAQEEHKILSKKYNNQIN